MPVKPPQDAVTVRRLRLGIGAVGIALPIVLIFGHALLTGRPTLLDSISGYYYSDMRNVFVGSMCAIGVFLICYRYDRLNDLLGTIAGVLAIAVALFPTAPSVPAGRLGSTDIIIGRVHQVCAAALFALLAIFCIFLFPRRSGRARVTPEKRGARNAIYYACGGVILGAITLAVASTKLPDSIRDTLKPLFWCEAVAVFAFGAAWLVKGEAMYRDSLVPDDPAGTGLVRGEASTGDSASPTGAPAGA